MLIAATLLVVNIPAAYMQPARYPAGSRILDTEAPGGFGTSDNFPTLNDAKTPKTFATLTRPKTDQGQTVEITLANNTDENIWLRAADSNLIIWLEARDGEIWKPIQYHMWYTCGNSYHRVAIEPGYHLTYRPIIPTGTLNTEIRLAYYDSLRRDSGKPQYSAPVKTSINPNLFQLDPEKSTGQRLTTEWTTPTLVPNG